MSTYLIDYENVMTGGMKGVSELPEDCEVYIFYTENADRMTFGLHQAINRSAARIFYLKVEAGSKNALDFQLATFLGYVIAKRANDNYCVVSNDRGFTPMVDFWRRKGIHISQASDMLPRQPKQKPQTPSQPGAVAQPAASAVATAPAPAGQGALAQPTATAQPQPAEMPQAEAPVQPTATTELQTTASAPALPTVQPAAEATAAEVPQPVPAAESQIPAEAVEVKAEATAETTAETTVSASASARPAAAVQPQTEVEVKPVAAPVQVEDYFSVEKLLEADAAAQALEEAQSPSEIRPKTARRRPARKPKAQTAAAKPAPATADKPAQAPAKSVPAAAKPVPVSKQEPEAEPEPEHHAEMEARINQLMGDYLEDSPAVLKILTRYKTKQGINNALVKSFGSDKAGIIYKIIKPLIPDKKGA